MGGKRPRPAWCDGTIKACLRCNITDFCEQPIGREETIAMKIGESLDGKGYGGTKKLKNAKARDRYIRDEAYRNHKLELSKQWRARKKAEQAAEQAG